MNFHDAIKAFQNAFHDMVNHAQKEIVEYATPAFTFIEQNGGKAVLTLAETVLMGAAGGTPWATLSASLIESAQAQGIALAEGAAGAILNFVKAKLEAEGKATA